MGLTLACFARLHENQLGRHLELFDHMPEVDRVLLVRPEPIDYKLTKLEQFPVGTAPLPILATRMAQGLTDLLRTRNVDWVISFNPIPWGSLASVVAKFHSVPVCVSMIGTDYPRLRRPFGLPFLRAIRSANAVTVTGNAMLEGMVELGVKRQRLRVLPHSVDTERFFPTEAERDLDIITVARLVRVKRLDVLLKAVARLKRRGILARVGIVGDGPLRAKLEGLTKKEDIRDCVEFLGFHASVERSLPRARIFALTSESEGMPFALMEALATGLVPVVTNVGTISDWVEEGKTGRFVRIGDPDHVANVLEELLGSRHELEALRENVVKLGPRLGFEHGVSCWREILTRSAL